MFKKSPKFYLFCFSSLLGLILFVFIIVNLLNIKDKERDKLTLNQRIELALNISKYRSIETINYLSKRGGTPGRKFPLRTKKPPFSNKIYEYFPGLYFEPQSMWVYGKYHDWTSGFFPALLWKIQEAETDTNRKKIWIKYAKTWSDPLRNVDFEEIKDVAANNVFIFSQWYTNSSNLEKKEQLNTIIKATEILAQPYINGQGNFHQEIGAFGTKRQAKNHDQQTHWQIFIDHAINVEQLLWSAKHNPDLVQSKLWKQQAISHIKTIGKALQKQQKNNNIGVGQRLYFDDDIDSPTYRKFLFSEGKQGWTDDSIWSRGQAWFIYASAITYYYTQDPEILEIAKGSINYFLDNLSYRNFFSKVTNNKDYIAPWDFNYAKQKKLSTERDSSASAIVASGILKLLKTLPKSDPDYAKYVNIVENILWDLTSSTYLPNTDEANASILKYGCYVHPKSIVGSSKEMCRHGVIWGDYFFVDALVEYQDFLRNNAH